MKKYISILFVFINISAFPQVSLQNLRCEMLVNPLGINVTLPRLSWEIQSTQRNTNQIACQIIVASTKENIGKNIGDLWSSGKMNSNQSIHIIYAGKALQSRTTCFWKVKVFTNNGESAWSDAAFFSIGLLNKNDWQAKWIGYDKASVWDSISQFSRLSARCFRKEFQTIAAIKKATVYVVGLGLYELFINGNKVGNNVLVPSPTDYRKTVLYNTYDITAMLHSGSNAVATVLSNGRFFTMRQNYKPAKITTFGYPKMLLQLEIEYTDGTQKIITSDESWKLNVDGPLRSANEYDGEEYDATKELTGWNNVSYNDNKWIQAELVNAPDGTVRSQMNEPMKVKQIIKPVSIKQIADSKYILDMGQNFSGWLQIKASGKAGEKIRLRFAESLQKNGSLYTANLRDAKATDVYTLKGNGIEVWHPCFVYHGFRYVEISNYQGTPSLSNFEGQVVFDDLSTIGTLQTSDTVVNKIIKNAWWGIASNYKGMPIDCPQRNERQPWLGDRTTGSFGESFVFDNAKLYAKWLDDIEESQTAEGAIPDVAPAFWNYYTDNVTWPGTYIFVANMLYQQFGDKQSVVKHYTSMKNWMLYMQSRFMKNGILTKDKYGDWCVPPESLQLIHAKDSALNTNGALIATAYYYQLLQFMKKFAKLSDQTDDIILFETAAQKIKTAFNEKFFNTQFNYYGNNTITANLLPLYFGIALEKDRVAVFSNIYKKIEQSNFHISTGVIGTQWLLRTLSNFNRTDVAYKLASNKTYPGWGYMTENGATTIWELWNGNTANPQMNSQNHVMLLGDLLIWLYENVGGIKSDEKEIAFKKIIMKPEMIAGLDSATATHYSLYGNIYSSWKKEKNIFNWNISIPANTTAQVEFSTSDINSIYENGKVINNQSDIKIISAEKDKTVLLIGSGTYHFKCKILNRK